MPQSSRMMVMLRACCSQRARSGFFAACVAKDEQLSARMQTKVRVSFKCVSALRQLVQILDIRARSALNALHLRIARLDHVILVGRVGAAAMSQAEVSGGQAQRVAGEDVSRPGAAEARQNDGINAGAVIDRSLRAND